MCREVYLLEINSVEEFEKLVKKVKARFTVTRVDYRNLVIEFLKNGKKVKVVCGLRLVTQYSRS